MNGLATVPAPRGRRVNWKLTAITIAVASVVLLVGANAHLVYVALQSQPDCVPHAKAPDGSGEMFRAAKSAC